MADLWQSVSSSGASSQRSQEGSATGTVRRSAAKGRLWIVLDIITIVVAAMLAALYRFRTGPVAEARGFWHGTLIHGRSMGILLVLLCGFAVALVMTSRRLHLYTPIRLTSFLHEQRLSVQACLYSGLLLTGTLYLIHAEDISRSVVLITVGLVTVALSLRRLVYRMLIYRRF